MLNKEDWRFFLKAVSEACAQIELAASLNAERLRT
jgi:hypothetical protein